MSSTLYVDAAAQVALTKRLESVASNIANSTTVGFRGDGVKFDSILSTTAGSNVAFPAAMRDYISTASGGALRTGNALDLAVRGTGWFSVMTPAGQAYTRDGRMQITVTGDLLSVNGYPFLDASGAPLQADPAAGEISFAADGALTQRGRQLGAIGLFTMDPSARLARYDNSAVIPDRPATPVLEFRNNGVMPGYLEQSNVNSVTEISRLIEIQRAFEHITACMDMTDTAQQEAIRTLGAQS